MLFGDRDPLLGPFQTVGCPVKLSDSAVKVQRTPQLGEHTGRMLTNLLELSADELARVKAESVA